VKRSLQALKQKTGKQNIVGERIRTARQQQTPPWTMERLSEMLEEHEDLEISISTIGRIESGTRSVYDYEIIAFARVLDVDLKWLLSLD
jgi:HTH-type transcriptional regulator, cell division transcriptional repressor